MFLETRDMTGGGAGRAENASGGAGVASLPGGRVEVALISPPTANVSAATHRAAPALSAASAAATEALEPLPKRLTHA